jgi:hypothetical protein
MHRKCTLVKSLEGEGYGSEDQTSLVRMKSRTYGQAHGESLSNVVQEFKRLVALGYKADK